MDNSSSVEVRLDSHGLIYNITVKVYTVNKCDQESVSAARMNIEIQPVVVGPSAGLDKPECPVSGK